MSFISQNMGVRNFKRVDRVLLECLGLVGVVGLVLGNGAHLLGPFAWHLYVGGEVVTWPVPAERGEQHIFSVRLNGRSGG